MLACTSHENGSKRVKDRFGCHFGILPFHTEEEEKKEDIQGYISTTDFTEASCIWKIPPPSNRASLPPIQDSLRKTWAEFHENKRTDWFTRNSSCDHRLKTRSRGNPATVPHELISSLVRGRLWWKRLHTNCLYAIQCEGRVRVRGRVRVHGRALHKQAFAQSLQTGVRLYPVQ